MVYHTADWREDLRARAVGVGYFQAVCAIAGRLDPLVIWPDMGGAVVLREPEGRSLLVSWDGAAGAGDAVILDRASLPLKCRGGFAPVALFPADTLEVGGDAIQLFRRP